MENSHIRLRCSVFPFIVSHAMLLLGSIIFVFNVISLFLPFAQYPKTIKVIIVIVGVIGGYILLGYLWKKTIVPKRDEIIKHWRRHALIAITFSLLIISLTPYHDPLVPVEQSIRIQSTAPIQYSHVTLEQGFGKWSILNTSAFVFEGAWNFHDGIAVHLGSEPGVIHYDQSIFISNPIHYHIYFSPQPGPAEAEVTVNGEMFQVRIPSSDETGDSFVFTVSPPQQRSSSLLYRTWLQILPFARAGLFVIFFFFASIYISARKSHNNTILVLYILLFVFSFLFYHSLNFQNEFINMQDHAPGFLAIALITFILIPLGIIAFLRKSPRLQPWILLLILLLAIGLRIYWIQMVPTAQVSDFGRFHSWALQLAQGKPGLFIDRYATFTRLLSLFYRIYPSAVMAQGLNIYLSLVTMLGLVWIGKETRHSLAGVLAAYFFSIFPSQIGMVGIVCTDILATTSLVLSAAFLISYLRRQKFYWLAGSAFLFGFAYMIRPPMLIYSPILILPLLLQSKRTLKQIGVYAVILVFAFIASVFATKAIIIPAQVDNMVIEEGKNVIWPLLNGTNIAEKGRNNDPDSALINNWTPEEAWQEGIPMVIDRVFSDPIAYYHLLKIKYNYMFGNAAYGADQAFLGEDMDFKTFTTGWHHPTQKIQRGYAQFSQYSYWCILIMGMAFVFRSQPNLNQLSWINLTILLCALGAYAFFEVQPRYQSPIIPFLILFAAFFFILPKTIEATPNQKNGTAAYFFQP